MKRRTVVASVAAVGASLVARTVGFTQPEAALATSVLEEEEMAQPASQTGYAPVNGLQMYYEIHGEVGVPLVLLHGAFSNINTDFGKVLPAFAASRQVIGIEQQAHGHTADIDRPLTYEQMADDTAALLCYLGIDLADIVGYSMGGAIALQLAIRHPQLVRKLVDFGGASYDPDGLYPELFELEAHMTADDMSGTPWQEAYARIAPHPGDFPALVAKMKELDLTWAGFPAEDIQSITAPSMIIIGDADIVRPEHAAALFRLLGGGVDGDLAGLPAARFGVLPGTTHVTIVDRTEWLTSMITEFLAVPIPEAT